MVLPTLTWNLVGPIRISSAGIEFSSGQKPKSHIMATLSRLVGSSSYWEVEITDTTGSFVEALVLRPRSASTAIPNMRVVATMNQSGALGGAASAQTVQDRSAGTADGFLANTLQIGLSPDISNAPTWVTGSWNSDRPWGTTVRFSKYWHQPASQNASIDQMYLLETSETLLVGVKGRRGNSAHFTWYGGAIAAGFDSGSGEADGRIYGMTVNGTTTVSTTFNTSLLSSPFGHSTSINGDHTGVFIVSGGVPNTQVSNTSNANYWELCNKSSVSTLSQQADAGDRGTNTTSEETTVVLPLTLTSNAAPFRMIGYIRQVYMIQDFPGLLPIVTGVNSNVVAGYTFGADSLNANDALLFANV